MTPMEREVEENTTEGDTNGLQQNETPPNMDASKFCKLVEEAQVRLYPRADKFNKLSFTLELYHLKCRYGMMHNSI